MGTFDAHLKCSIGGSHFNLSTYTLSDDPIIENGAAVGRKYAVQGSGYIEAASAQAFATTLAAALGAMAVSGQTFTITSHNSVQEVIIPAARCVDGGPHVKYTIKPGDAPFRREIEFTVDAQTFSSSDDETYGGGGGGSNSQTESVKRSPSGYVVVTRKGELRGPNGAAQFLNGIVPAFQASYPWPNWVIEHEYDAAADQKKVTYTLTARELYGSLQRSGIQKGSYAVDGSATVSVSRDEQMRKITIYNYDLVFTGDPWALLNWLRPLERHALADVEGEIVLRERSQVQTLGEPRLQATFEVLTGGNGNRLLNWRQSIRVQPADPAYDEKLYPGAAPILLRRPSRLPRLVQEGSCIGAGTFFKPAKPMFPDRFLEAPEVSLVELNHVERETTWRYIMAAPLHSVVNGLPQYVEVPSDDPQSGFIGPAGISWEQVLRPENPETTPGVASAY